MFEAERRLREADLETVDTEPGIVYKLEGFNQIAELGG